MADVEQDAVGVGQAAINLHHRVRELEAERDDALNVLRRIVQTVDAGCTANEDNELYFCKYCGARADYFGVAVNHVPMPHSTACVIRQARLLTGLEEANNAMDAYRLAREAQE